jgi:hypothetical protein
LNTPEGASNSPRLRPTAGSGKSGVKLPAAHAVAAAPATIAGNEPDDEEKYDRAEGSTDDLRNNADAEVDSQLRKKPAAEERAEDANDEVADEAEPAAVHQLSREPASDDADQDDYDETVVGNVHKECPQRKEGQLERGHIVPYSLQPYSAEAALRGTGAMVALPRKSASRLRNEA